MVHDNTFADVAEEILSIFLRRYLILQSLYFVFSFTSMALLLSLVTSETFGHAYEDDLQSKQPRKARTRTSQQLPPCIMTIFFLFRSPFSFQFLDFVSIFFHCFKNKLQYNSINLITQYCASILLQQRSNLRIEQSLNCMCMRIESSIPSFLFVFQQYRDSTHSQAMPMQTNTQHQLIDHCCSFKASLSSIFISFIEPFWWHFLDQSMNNQYIPPLIILWKGRKQEHISSFCCMHGNMFEDVFQFAVSLLFFSCKGISP